MTEKQIPFFYPATTQDWRDWLAQYHQSEDAVWVIFYKKKSIHPSISWSEAVDEALCFGWIDSVKKKLDEERSIQFFSKRKPTSTWSKINKDKVERLIKNGLMTPKGYECIEIAKQNGTWTILDEVEALTIPQDLEDALNAHTDAKDYFLSHSKTVKKMMLQWIVMAKRPETRQKRIAEIATFAAEKKKPKPF